MRDWMISKKRYWGLALPIYACEACGSFDVIGGREELQRARRRGLGGVRGPHAASAVRGRGQDRLLDRAVSRSSRIADVGNPWLDAGIVPFSTLHFRERARLLGEVVSGRLRHRELPRPVPQLVLRDARDGHRAPSRAAVPDPLRLRPAVRRGRPADAQELGQRDRVRRGGRSHGRRRHALDVRLGAARGQHPVRLARRRRGASRAAGPLERLRVPRDYARLAGGRRAPGDPPVEERPALDRWILSRAAATAADVEARLRDYDAERRRATSAGSSTTCRRGTCGCRASGCRAATTPPSATRRSRRSTQRSSRSPAMMAPILPFLTERCTGTSSSR